MPITKDPSSLNEQELLTRFLWWNCCLWGRSHWSFPFVQAWKAGKDHDFQRLCWTVSKEALRRSLLLRNSSDVVTFVHMNRNKYVDLPTRKNPTIQRAFMRNLCYNELILLPKLQTTSMCSISKCGERNVSCA